MGLRPDPSVFFYKSFFDDVTNCSFNPGGPVPSFATCDRGLGPMADMPKTPEQMERAKKIEKKAEETKGRQTLGESLALDATDLTAPPAMYEEFRDMCVTFAGTLFLTMGEDCKLYDKVLTICLLLEDETVAIQTKEYDGYIVRSYTWAIICDCSRFFHCRLHPDDFAPGAREPNWPTSL